ncbi:zinc-dependent alcohol dehydrogenase family protein [Arsenicicoccus sp. oral taxon 190]|uniref:zinc-dependent alcohol dehydrogenase family protein n=1 Tax=Arsenicicoccus sp. oral taxon 190 TaxID=1658671 RepID=UPI00067A2680|nr:zinc-dependent alcohol dehydrogenase family protein [Arsenicicoccus sp. oral taxon 190]AKT50355.1 IMP dehydrogenase [Arsenicicoccus sp. oral taxon 190]
MRATMIHAPRDIRLEQADDPSVLAPTDAVIRVVRSCICGSDLWPYRGVNPTDEPHPIGHEYVGVVEAVGDEVRSVRAGEFVVGGFTYSDNTCEICREGVQSACVQVGYYGSPDRAGLPVGGCQAEYLRVPLADGTLVATPEMPSDDLLPSLLTLSDVMATGWHAAVSAGVREGSTVAVVGDGAVGLCGVLAARELGAERIIAMSRHEARQQIARDFGATDVVAERGDEGAARVHELTGGFGAHAVLECVGTKDSMAQAFASARPGGMVGFVGVPHGGEAPMERMFRKNIGLRGGMAPVRAYLPDLLGRVLDGRIDPGRVFDLTLPLDDVAEGYRAMDERRATKVLLTP